MQPMVLSQSCVSENSANLMVAPRAVSSRQRLFAKISVFFTKNWEIFGQLCFSSVNSNNFASSWEISPNS
jgi:hypothetical protein